MTSFRVEYLGAFFIALLLRAIYLQSAWYGNELIDFPIVDADVYVEWAKDILQGNWLWAESKNYTPVYPVYLASWFAVLGERTFSIFLIFHVIGAAQAVVIGLLAEEVWDWREGLLAALLAAVYWPFVVFEASFYAETFTLWTASLGLLLLVRSARANSSVGLLGAGLLVGLAGLTRVNLLLCFPVVCCWLVFERVRTLRRRAKAGSTDSTQPVAMRDLALAAARPAIAFALPVLLLSAPIVAWNWHVTDRPMLRAQSGITLFLGNNPEFGGLVVRPGVEWRDLMIEPLRAGMTTAVERNEYWNERTLETIKAQPGEWFGLQWKKLSMHLGAFEVSQEIDISRFRNSSPILALPIWPGFGFIMPLAIAGAIVAFRRREQAVIPLALFALCYIASLLPFQAAARYRLPVLVVLIPLAAHLLVWAWDRARTHELAEWREWLWIALVIGVSLALVLPDYTNLRFRNSVRHDHFVAMKYYERDPQRALRMLAESASFDPRDADSPLWMGQLRLAAGEFEQAEADFKESRLRYQPNPEALFGLAQLAMKQGDYDTAREQMALAFAEWPHSQPGLRLLKEIALEQQDWETVRDVLTRLRNYSAVPASELFELGVIAELFGDYETALSAYHQIAGNMLYASPDRARALFTTGVMQWRYAGDVEAALEVWRSMAGRVDFVFGSLAAYLVGDLEVAALAEQVPERGATGQFAKYTRGLASWMAGDMDGARAEFRAIVDQRDASSLPRFARSVPESWALADLERLRIQ